jgi:membrane-associated phospholipid phosphatase
VVSIRAGFGYEYVAFVYFAAIAVAALVRPLAAGRRTAIAAVAVSMCAATIWLSRIDAAGIGRLAPFAVILIGYYVSGLFALAPSPRFEGWLLARDRQLFGNPATRFAGWPRALLAILETVYIGCFLILPAGLGTLVVAAVPPPIVDRYWLMVVTAEFASFISLAFVYARPPWMLEQRAALPDRAIHRAATRFVQYFTIRANTFPSGHAAGSVAVALGVIGVLPAAGAALLILALAIGLAAVVGRFHYAIDVIAGILLALAIFATLG